MKKIKQAPEVFEQKHFCPKCGVRLMLIRQPNEEDYYTNSLYSMYGWNRAGDKFDKTTGKRLHRTVWECPNKDVSGWFCKKSETHYSRLQDTGLID